MARLKYWNEEAQAWEYADKATTIIKPDLTGYATEEYVDDAIGNIETALDNIIAIQDALIGGNA